MSQSSLAPLQQFFKIPAVAKFLHFARSWAQTPPSERSASRLTRYIGSVDPFLVGLSFLVLFRPLLTSDISQAGAMLSPNPWTAELAAHVSVLAMAHCPDTLRDRSWANPKAAPKLTLLSFVAAALQGPTTLELPVSAASFISLRRRPC